MSVIYLAPGLNIDSEVTSILQRRLPEVFGLSTLSTTPFVEAEESYDPQREQYSTVLSSLLS